MTKKNKLLLAGIAVLLVLCYQLGIKKTHSYYKQYKQLKGQEASLESIPKQLRFLKERNEILDQELAKRNAEAGSIQNALLRFLNKVSEEESVRILEFLEPHLYTTEQEEIETFIFEVEGSYGGILKVVNALESNGSFGAVSHVAFEKNRHPKTRKTSLHAVVFLEQIK